MTRMTTPADDSANHGADDRRKTDRRNRSLAFDGQDRRLGQRRTLRDRRRADRD